MNEIDPNDLLIEHYNTHPPGGQHTGMTSRGVKVTHIPSGLVAISECERSQHRNRNIAIDMILGALTSPHFRG